MQFENSFEVAGEPELVMALFRDVPLMASFLPGADIAEQQADGQWPATLTVALGPKRLAFKGLLANIVEPERLRGTVVGHASANLRGTKMSLQMDYQLSVSGAGTRVHLVSEAELTGMLAEFARTGGVVVTQALLAEFSQRLSAHVRSLQAAAAPAQPFSSQPAPAALSMLAVALQVLKSVWRLLLGGPRA